MVYVDHLASDPFSALPGNEAALLQVLGYYQATQWQENGISVALLTA